MGEMYVFESANGRVSVRYPTVRHAIEQLRREWPVCEVSDWGFDVRAVHYGRRFVGLLKPAGRGPLNA